MYVKTIKVVTNKDTGLKMAKRFTDTNKYKKRFIRSLPGPYKLLWDYLYHDCDHAGIWQVDFEVAQLYLGKDMVVTLEESLRLFKDRIVVLDGGNKWFIIPFVEFQYGELNPSNRLHSSVIAILKKEGAYKHLASPLQGTKDKDMDKDKDIKRGYRGDDAILTAFDSIWSQYPKKVHKPDALRWFKATVKTPEDVARIQKALDNYKASERVAKGYVQDGSTWFHDWQSWENPPDANSAIPESCKEMFRKDGIRI